MKQTVRKLLPNLVTLTGLVCAFSSVILTLQEELTIAGVCILAGYLLDAIDGALARRLGVTSPFGLQLDSLVDLVTFGVAPSTLAYQHLRDVSLNPTLAWVICAAFVVGGAFRLARFNLLPTKKSSSESVGLTISTSGATLALGVLVDRAHENPKVPGVAFVALMALLTFLMVSRIRYPALASVFGRRRLSAAILGATLGLAVQISPPLAGFGLTGGYVSFGLIRALYYLAR